MKVALVGPVAPLRGGIAHHTTSLAAAFARRGDDVRVLSYRRQYPRLFFPGRSEHEPRATTPPVPALPLLTSLGPHRWLEGIRALRAFAPDLVVTAYWNAALLGPSAAVLAAARHHGWRGVVLAHNVRSHDRPSARLDEVAWRALSALAVGALTQTEEDARWLSRRHPGLAVRAHGHPRYDRFQPGVPRGLARRRLGLAPDDEVALCLGNVRPYKGVDLALEALAWVAKTRPRLRLVVAGEVYDRARGPLLEALRKVPPGHVRLVDRYLDDDEVVAWVSAADVLLAPHRAASHSGVVQVAKALGLPVIASDAGGLPELLDPGVDVCVRAHDARALAHALRAFFARPPARPVPPSLEAVRAEWESLAAAITRLAGLP